MATAMVDREELGYRLRRLRKRADWTQTELALAAFGSGDASRVSRLENGEAKRPEFFVIQQLADALGKRLEIDRERILQVLLKPPDDFFSQMSYSVLNAA